MNKRKMFLLISALVVLNTLTYSAPKDDAENTLNQIDKSIEQEKQRIEQEKQRKEFENTKFNSTVPEEVAPVQDNGIKFLINNINIEDKDKLLSSGEKKKLMNESISTSTLNEIDGNIPTTDVIVPTSPVENEGTTNVQQTINQLRERVGE